jgi:short-subunit dehydrogenase
MSQPIPAGSLSGRTALVTGSSRGIGADTVTYLAQAGANVVINFRNKAPRAEKLAAQLRELGVEVLVVGADLTDPASVAGHDAPGEGDVRRPRHPRPQCVRRHGERDG